jgi:hypothetical protein
MYDTFGAGSEYMAIYNKGEDQLRQRISSGMGFSRRSFVADCLTYHYVGLCHEVERLRKSQHVQ